MVSSLISDHRIALAQSGTARISVPIPEGEGYSRQLSCQIWSLEGQLVGRSDGAPDAQLTAPSAGGYSQSVVEGELWRVYTVVNPDLGVRVMVGDSLAVRDRLVRDVIEGLLLPAAVILPVLGAFIWISVARGLAPLDRLAETLRSRSPSDLSPLPEGPAPQEIRPVRRALNALFSRVSQARDAERDFTTFAAHELKTPLAGLRTQAQIARMAQDDETRNRALQAIEKSIDRTDRMTRKLLELAEVERECGAEECVNLESLVSETVAELGMLADEHGVLIQCDAGEGSAGLRTNPFLLHTALRNVIENAILVSPKGGRVRITVKDRGSEVVLSIDDMGPGIPEQLRERVTERFFKGPYSPGTGSGLGLAIVASAMERLSGRLSFAETNGCGQRVDLYLPRSEHRV